MSSCCLKTTWRPLPATYSTSANVLGWTESTFGIEWQLPVVQSSSGVICMGRRRKHQLDLPPKLYQRGSSYYYVSAGKWTWLARSKPEALRLWAMLEGRETSLTVGQLVGLWLSFRTEQGQRDSTKALSQGTLKQYTFYARVIDDQFVGKEAASLTVKDVAKWQLSAAPIVFNGCLSVLRNSYRWGVVADHVPENPLRDVEELYNETKVRPRLLTDEEFAVIREQAPQWLQIAMDLAYLTGLRKIDVFSLQWSQIKDGWIHVAPQKVRRFNIRQRFAVTEEVAEVLARARSGPVVGLYVVAGTKGRPYARTTVQRAFSEACSAAGVADAQFRDIRAKYATDGTELGLDVQAGLGHTNKRQTDRYVKGKRTITAPVLRRSIG